MEIRGNQRQFGKSGTDILLRLRVSLASDNSALGVVNNLRSDAAIHSILAFEVAPASLCMSDYLLWFRISEVKGLQQMVRKFCAKTCYLLSAMAFMIVNARTLLLNPR